MLDVESGEWSGCRKEKELQEIRSDFKKINSIFLGALRTPIRNGCHVGQTQVWNYWTL